MVYVACFGIRASVMFHHMFVHYTFFRFGLLSGQKPPARFAICSHCLLSICNIYLYPVLVIRVGFGFLLLQFLFIAFLLFLLVSPLRAPCRTCKTKDKQ